VELDQVIQMAPPQLMEEMAETIQIPGAAVAAVRLLVATMVATLMLVLVAKDLHRQSMEPQEFTAVVVGVEHTQGTREAQLMQAAED
jgi:hypothetical protein